MDVKQTTDYSAMKLVAVDHCKVQMGHGQREPDLPNGAPRFFSSVSSVRF